MNQQEPLVNNHYLLEKFPGKGGWTYARVPEIPQDKEKPFGWVKVRGTVDGYELKKYNLMPMGDGRLFLPVKAEIRKKIQKEAGDTVHVVLYLDEEPLEVPAEMWECLRDEPKALKFFESLSESEQKCYIDWVYGAKQEETKVERLAKSVTRLANGKKFYDA
jgi:hypothetical protein